MSAPTGWILWEGPSEIDGAPIVVIAAGLRRSRNKKTGAMVQTYILRADVHPVQAVNDGRDASVCGDCKLRGPMGKRKCYVRVEQGAAIVWKRYRAGLYPRATLSDIVRVGEGRMVRLGTYGDPAAAPASVWGALVARAKGHTGYTHQWRVSPDLSALAMASVDSPLEREQATAAGWRTFRVTMPEGARMKGEAVCPASEEAGRKLTCIDCRACGGTSTGARGDIVIQLHGALARHAARRAA